jgi:FMN-dependent oxidoreductase (nitrilotriacetate monooxygenase family)
VTALADATDDLGLIASASTSFYEPYVLATKLATIDALSDGRVGWNVVTSSGRNEFANVHGEYLDHDERYDRAEEFLAVCYALWTDSWADDAIVRDANADTFVDPEAVSRIDHEGECFSVAGPFGCAPTPQRALVLFQVGQSERGRAVAACHAEVAFAFALSRDAFADHAADLRARDREAGRNPDDIRVCPGITPYVAETTAAAEAARAEVRDLVEPETGLVRLSSHLEYDYSRHALDEPLRDVPAEGIRGVLRAFLDDDRAWTIGEAAKRYARYPVPEPAGTPAEVADELERWLAAGADGFVVMPALVPRTFHRVTERLVPELRDRGLLADDAGGGTLRKRLCGTDEPNAKHPAGRRE